MKYIIFVGEPPVLNKLKWGKIKEVFQSFEYADLYMKEITALYGLKPMDYVRYIQYDASINLPVMLLAVDKDTMLAYHVTRDGRII